jgi:hypothetical protein
MQAHSIECREGLRVGHEWSASGGRERPEQNVIYLNSCVAFELIVYFHHGISPLRPNSSDRTGTCNRHRLHPKLHTADLKVLSQIINLLNLRKLPLMIKFQILE